MGITGDHRGPPYEDRVLIILSLFVLLGQDNYVRNPTCQRPKMLKNKPYTGVLR